MARHPEVERLFARHSLGPVRSVELLTGGQLNTALRVNGTHVLRYREATRVTGSLKREAAVLNRIKGRLPAPEVVASGLDDILGEYLITTALPGRSMLGAWLETPDVTTREWWLAQWTAALKTVHEERFPRPGELVGGELKPYPTWRAYVEARIRKRVDLLMRVPSMDRGLVLAAERYLRRHASVLEDGPWRLIHRDLHFGNVLVQGPHVTGILDFELAEVGPPDYELDTIYRFLRYPAQFAAPGTPGVTAGRFASVWIRLRRGYPELFTVRRLRDRLCLYALDHDLSALLEAYSGRWGGEGAAERAVRRIGEILQGRYGPEDRR